LLSVHLRAEWPLAAVVLMVVLSGCVDPGHPEERPSLEIVLSSDEVRADEVLEVEVRFTNTARVPFEVRTQDGCIRVSVWAQAGGSPVPFDAPTTACPGAPGSVVVRSGESMTWGPFRLMPGEFRQGGAEVFQPGMTYPVVADLETGSSTWDVRSESSFRVLEPLLGLQWELVADSVLVTTGQPLAFHARVTNPRDENYT
jgi:hypothetical protein